MNHSSCTTGARKRKAPSRDEKIEYPAIYQRLAQQKQAPDGNDSQDLTPWRSAAIPQLETHRQHINRSQHWELLYRPLTPPRESSPTPILPSFSALSGLAGNYARDLAYQHPAGYREAFSWKSASLDSYHHKSPATPVPSVSSRSLSTSTSSSSPPFPAPRTFLERPDYALAVVPARMQFFTGATGDSKPHRSPPSMSPSSEFESVVPSSATKRHCRQLDTQQCLQDRSMGRTRQASPNPLQQQPQGVSILPPSALHLISEQPTSFYTTLRSPIGFEHHHYISPSSAAYQLPQDRYNCPECGRAFSRPSSLKIHTYSHTGEKPFHCPVRGCDKTFSVRSNMKRHERGCHARKK